MNPAGKTILVAGASGLSGRGAARMLAGLGARVVLADRSTEPRQPEELAGRDVRDERGRDEIALLDEYDFDAVVTAPGVPLAAPFFGVARERNIPIYGENDLAFEMIRRHWKQPPFTVGITGTDGKSTTTALLAALIEATTDRRAFAGGNFGRPLSLLFDDPAARDQPVALVVECSSYQLEPQRFFHPDISMILNLADDHLDRYPDRAAYLDAKLNILERATQADLFLAPPEILAAARRRYGAGLQVRTAAIDCGSRAESIAFAGAPLMGAAEVGLRGDHNLCNIRFALVALEDLARRTGTRVDPERLAAALREFRGLEHRMEPLGRAGKLEFINDSKATTVQAVESAVSSLLAGPAGAAGRVYLLAGGRDKGVDFGPLGRLAARIFPYGEAAGLIARAVSADTENENLSAAFEAALDLAWRETEAGRSPGVLILSPGCASFDEFRNYGERGAAFKALVRDFLDSIEDESGERLQGELREPPA